MRVHPLHLALTLLAPAIAIATAQPAHEGASSLSPAAVHTLDAVVVTATRTTRVAGDVANTVDIVDRQKMDDELVVNLKDLFRYDPGISVSSGYGRFGISDIRIRGLGGNRVLIQTDGIPVSDAFVIGSFSNANRNFVDLDTLKRVEVLRGAGSSLYGSDALGGVVSFQTKDPVDYLQGKRQHYVDAKLGYQGQSRQWTVGSTLALGGKHWSSMLVANGQHGAELRNRGDNHATGRARTAPNPQNSDGRSVLAKLVYAPDSDQSFKLTVEHNRDTTDTNILSSLGFQPFTRATNSKVTGDDRQTRNRVSLSHQVDGLESSLADHLTWQVYRQDSKTRQGTLEERVTAGGVQQRREREFSFDQRLLGAETTLFKHVIVGSVDHSLTYGFALKRTRTDQMRDGMLTVLPSGTTSKVVPPDVFPVRDVPISFTTTSALFVQDEIGLFDGRFRLIPAVRMDRYELKPRLDNIYADDNPGVAVVGLRETSVSPKLGAVWHVTGDWSLFGGYARGFRSPPYNDVNAGFTNVAFGYTTISNPALKPETSDGFELGVRYNSNVVQASLSAYDNRYDDFIESRRFIGINDQGLRVFQSQNVDKARIYGVELKSRVELGRIGDALAGWSIRTAAASSRGTNRNTGTPLVTIDPLRASLGLAFDRDNWGAELAGSFAQRQQRPGSATQYAPGGYGVVDFMAHWRPSAAVRIRAGIFNLGDKKYVQWPDVPGVETDSAGLDRYTRPGRTVAMSVLVSW